MKAIEIFDVCHGRYRGLREWLDDSGGAVRSLDLEKPSEAYHWRPGRPRACEYVADFERIGRHALRRPEWKGRLKLFNIYFLHSIEYRRAIALVGVAEGTFDYWYREVKRALGSEFSRTNLYPPAQYFRDITGALPIRSNMQQMPEELHLSPPNALALSGGAKESADERS